MYKVLDAFVPPLQMTYSASEFVPVADDWYGTPYYNNVQQGLIAAGLDKSTSTVVPAGSNVPATKAGMNMFVTFALVGGAAYFYYQKT